VPERLYTRTTTTHIDRLDDGNYQFTSVLQDNVHDVTLRIVINREMDIVEADGKIAASPFPKQCDQVSPKVGALVGMRIGPGFSKQALDRIGGNMGCHRYVDLVRDVARSSGQVPFIDRFQDRRSEWSERPSAEKRMHAIEEMPGVENTCWSYNRANDALFEVE